MKNLAIKNDVWPTRGPCCKLGDVGERLLAKKISNQPMTEQLEVLAQNKREVSLEINTNNGRHFDFARNLPLCHENQPRLLL